MKNHDYAVIMAGGVGSRFWPVSKQTNPKQFQDILGCGKTLIQTTYNRLSRFIPPSNIYILTNEIYESLVKEQLPEVTPEQIVMEPVMRNTAPCILLAAMKIFKRDAAARMLVAPSDHWIQTEANFQKDMKMALQASEDNQSLFTFGVRPCFPNTGYGYIEYQPDETRTIFNAIRFTEKPDFRTAQRFIYSGNYLWNSGIFVWKTSSILAKFKTYLPEMFSLFSKGRNVFNTVKEKSFLIANYHLAENISIDFGIIEKSKHIKVIPAGFSWNDLGTWGSLQDELPHDIDHNTVINSRFIPNEAKGNIIRTENKKVVYIEGLRDYMILENQEVLLIIPKNKEQEIKQIRQNVMSTHGLHLG
ncbi:mannose-1-phosphate guanylyltransferase [Robertkochia marina]|uniref:mannose-1-phosphate guanylyltransferase n=1 Tax=Robertkochia marina TaxID=1227945 RepID=A0A4S3LZN3_9FLAO|nr:mannose-1-phosphate guanylyltransferase [Robertkochia marina]THD67600.1 mannose-1-phosphate guanylyltransferase [Robertkochia marina]TRZ44531.1 mannose-1-phosphate guanylyltransferase [Robertkochia marina]